MQDPTRTKKITIPKRLILSQLLRESSFSRDPMVDNRKKASHSEEKITVLIRSNFVLTKEERKRHNGKFPQWGSERFQTVMSNIVQRRLKASQSIESLVIEGENVFKDAYWLRNESVFFHSLGCARAVYMGLVSYFGEKPPHASTSFVRGRVSAITTSRSYPILSLITHFLRKLPKDMIEKDLVKLIKLSFCGSFSFYSKQELPEGFSERGIPLMPDLMKNYVHKRCKTSNQMVRLYFTLQQCKSLCHTVPDSFLNDGLQKHRNGICRKPDDLIPIDDNLYNCLKKFSSERVGKIIGDSYRFDKTILPNQKSCYEASRSQGGVLGQLLAEEQLSRGVNPLNFDGKDRIEPIVVGFFGPPGSGKSTAINQLVLSIGRNLFPNLKKTDLSYSRSCATKHWDGYDNQPIVVMDDFGQDTVGFSDISEFCQLVSTNPYVLPMAELSEKGRMFTSPIIIVTSNLVFGGPMIRNGIRITADSRAIWRRFCLPYDIFRGSIRKIMCDLGEISPNHKGTIEPGLRCLTKDLDPLGTLTSTHSPDLSYGDPRNLHDVSNEVCMMLNKHLDYHRRNLTGSWVQEIDSVQFTTREKLGSYDVDIDIHDSPVLPGIHTYIKFPLEPPQGLPPTKVVALAEPLKVRCITAGEANLKVLQPLQKAMWNSLRHFPEFCLTHGISESDLECERFGSKSTLIFDKMEKEINRLFRSSSSGTWLSGDYTAATDNLPMWVTEALMEGILEHIDHEPTKKWARYEIGPHQLKYPVNSGVPDGTQNSGQLMGSLLSFPLLCLANAFIVEYSGIKPGSYLVNGDDIVAFTDESNIKEWKRNAPRIGLSLSLGKNFVSDEFCTVNSQLFQRNSENDTMHISHTGKASLLIRDGGALADTFADFQRLYGFEDIFRNIYIQNNYKSLQKTPCSLSVPRSHGGLGSVFLDGRKVNQKQAKEVYMTNLWKKVSKKGLSDFKKMVGYDIVYSPFVKDELYEQLGGSLESNQRILNRFLSLYLPKSDKGESLIESEISFKDLFRFRKEFSEQRKNSPWRRFRDIIDDPSVRIRDLPSLEKVGFQVHFVPVHDAQAIQKDLISRFVQDFITGVRSDEEDFGFMNEELTYTYIQNLNESLQLEKIEELKEIFPEENLDEVIGLYQGLESPAANFYQILPDDSEFLLNIEELREKESRFSDLIPPIEIGTDNCLDLFSGLLRKDL